MPTVDDLVISLTVKPTSELGKLKKMLDELAKPQGAGSQLLKQFEVKIPQAMQEDISFIKKNVVFLMPTNLPGPVSVKSMVESASRQITILKKDLSAYADKLIPTGHANIQKMLAEYDASSVDELRGMLEERVEGWAIVLDNIASGMWTDDKAHKFMGMIQRLISEKEIKEGERKSLIDDIEKGISEFQKEIQELLKAEGIQTLAQVFLAKILPEKFDDIFSSHDEGFRESVSEMIGAIGIEKEEFKKTFTRWMGQFGSTEKGTLHIMEIIGKELGYTLEQLYKLKPEEVKKDIRLQALGALLLKKMGMTKVKQKGVPLGFQPFMLKFVKKIRTGSWRDLSKLSDEMREKQEERLKEDGERFDKQISGISKMFERGKIDIVMLKGWQDKLDKLEELFGTKFVEGIKDIKTSLGVELKPILTESNRAQFRLYSTLWGESLTGIASVVKDSFTDLFPKITTAQINVWKLLTERELRTPKTEVELRKLMEDNLKDIPDEKALKTMMDVIKTSMSYLTKPITEEEKELSEEQKELSERISDDMLLKLISSPDWQEKKMTPEKIMEEIKVNETIKELQEDMSNEELKKALNNAFILMLEKMSAIYSQLTKRGKESLFSQETKVEPEVRE